jgi:hypothetical protein
MCLFFVSYITAKCPRRLDVSQIATRSPAWVPGTENRQPVTTPGPLVPPTYRYTTLPTTQIVFVPCGRPDTPLHPRSRRQTALFLRDFGGAGPGGSVTVTVTRDADCLARAVPVQGYGMTEAGPVLSMCPAFAKEPAPAKPGSCGTVVRNAELKVVDPDTGLSLGRNLPGEICIRGPQIMKGNEPPARDARCTVHSVSGWLTGRVRVWCVSCVCVGAQGT